MNKQHLFVKDGNWCVAPIAGTDLLELAKEMREFLNAGEGYTTIISCEYLFTPGEKYHYQCIIIYTWKESKHKPKNKKK